MDYRRIVDDVMATVTPHIGERAVLDRPARAEVNPRQFGFAVATANGEVFGGGDMDTAFSLDSISKVFTLALVLSRPRCEIWRRVRREPSGTPSNSLVQLEIEDGIPRNPYIDSGAMVVTDQLLSDTGDAFDSLRGLLRAETGASDVRTDPFAFAARPDGHRELAAVMAGFNNIRNPVDNTLDHYHRQHSITMNCRQLAKAGLLVARHGVRADGSRMLHRSDAHQILTLMTTCGTDDSSGEFAFRVGMPCKSGAGGGILAVVPDHCAVAAWSPGLDANGNSVTGAIALRAFARACGHAVL